MEIVNAHFGLLPGFAKEVKRRVRTYNARSETVAILASFQLAWAKPRHWIVPGEAIYVPAWRTGKHIPTRCSAADGGTLGAAGICLYWITQEGQWADRFAMLTIDADDHALLRNMQRTDPTRPRGLQDKRRVVILPDGLYEARLDATAANSMAHATVSSREAVRDPRAAAAADDKAYRVSAANPPSAACSSCSQCSAALRLPFA